MKNYLSIIFLTVLGFSVKAQKLSIGQPYQGGIVFYLDSLKQFGLIAAEKDLNPETIEKGVFPYYCLPCYGSFVAGSTDTIIGSGKQNSINLLTHCPTLNSFYNVLNISAISVCDTLRLNGFDDWYLPSKDELKLLYQLRNTVGNFSTSRNGLTVYGSSSEYSTIESWDIQFNYDGQVLSPFERRDIKGTTFIVRPVRTFSYLPSGQAVVCPPFCVPFTARKIANDPNPPQPVFALLAIKDNKGVAARINNQIVYSLNMAGTDYYAARGGVNPKELTLFAAIGGAERISLFLKSATAVGTYDLGGNSQSNGIYTTLSSNGNLVNYSTDSTRTGVVQITTYDAVQGLVSGFFNFRAVSPTGEIELKEGEFENVPLF